MKSIVPQPDITRNEITELVRLAYLGDEKYLEILEKNVTHPFVSDLVFYPSDVLDIELGEPTEQEIAEFLISYKANKLSKIEQTELLEKHLSEGLSRAEFQSLSENLVGFELNYFSSWLKTHNLSAGDGIDLIHSKQITSDYAATIHFKS